MVTRYLLTLRKACAFTFAEEERPASLIDETIEL